MVFSLSLFSKEYHYLIFSVQFSVAYPNYNLQKLDDPHSFGIRVKQVVLVFRSDDDTIESTVNQLCDGINSWRYQLYERIQLLGKPVLSTLDDGFFERSDRATGIELYDSQDYSLVQTNGTFSITAHLDKIEDYLTRDDIEQILNTIDISKQLKPEYRLYLKALMEINAGHTRYAILEATTACELCITGVIRTHCEELGINGNALCQALFRSLGDRFDLLKYLGITLATPDPNKEIVKPRNDLFHNRTVTPALKDCNNVLNAIRKYLDLYIPGPY